MTYAITVVALWILVIGSIGQTFAHLIGWLVLRPQKDESNFGIVLKWREFTLGAKNLSGSLFDMMLLGSVIYNFNATDSPLLAPVLVAVAVTTFAAFLIGLVFIYAVLHPDWGQPRGTISTQTEQTIEQTAADVAEIRLDVKGMRDE